MKDIFEVLDLEVIKNLPSAEHIESAVTRISELQQIPTTRDFHAANIQYSELEHLLARSGEMFMNGKKRSTYIGKLQQLKPTTNVPTIDFI